jgi:hypothetical protein
LAAREATWRSSLAVACERFLHPIGILIVFGSILWVNKPSEALTLSAPRTLRRPASGFRLYHRLPGNRLPRNYFFVNRHSKRSHPG